MATTTTTTSTTKAQLIKVQAQPIKPKRRRFRETTISSSASTTTTNNSESACYLTQTRKHDPPTIASPDNFWFRPASKPLPTPPPPSPPPQKTRFPINHSPQPDLVTTSPSEFKILLSPGSQSPVMEFTTTTLLTNGHHHIASPNEHSSFPSSFTKFNSALTAGLLNPMSPPPPDHKPRSSPTLFEMMASEPEMQPRTIAQIPIIGNNGNINVRNTQSSQMTVQDRQALILQRITNILGNRSPGNQFNDSSSSDVNLTLSSKDGISVSMNVHRQILVGHSRFFAVKLSDKWANKQQRMSAPYVVEIADCDDVEVYIETLRLMYCKDLRRKLMKEDVSRVLGILKVKSLFFNFCCC
jgi:hypothetical protein